MKKRIGIFGGSFNPIHNAHLSIAEDFIRELNLDFCLFVPAYLSPFRLDDSSMIKAELRLEMTKLAISYNYKFILEDFEISKANTSYTKDTIQYLSNKYKNDDLFLLIGADQAERFHLWNDYQYILNKSQLCIAKRPEYTIDENILNDLSLENKKPILINSNIFYISSSEIRKRIKNGESNLDDIPKVVKEFIINNKLYI